MKVKITEIEKTEIKGVTVFCPNEITHEESYFEWTQSALTTQFATNEISGGTIKAWHSKLEFTELEYHIDREMFYFTSGVAIMIFTDIKNGAIDIGTCQIVSIKAGTQLVIEANKAHFVAIAKTDEPVTAVVVAPRMDAPRIVLTESVEGIY